jgi:hypothetical protein
MKTKITQSIDANMQATAKDLVLYDDALPGFCLRIRPTSGCRAERRNGSILVSQGRGSRGRKGGEQLGGHVRHRERRVAR